MHQTPRQPEQREQHGQAVAIGGLAVHVETEQAQHRREADALQAVQPAGDVGQLVRRFVEHQRHTQRHHQPRQVGAAQHQKTADQAQRAGHRGCQQQAQQRVADAMHRQQACRIGTGAKERCVAQRDQTGVAQDQVQRQRKQRGDRYLRQQRQIVGKHKIGQQRQQPEAIFRHAPARGAAHGTGIESRGSRCGRRGGGLGHLAATRPNRP